MSLYLMLTAAIVLSGIVMITLTVIYNSPVSEGHKLRTARPRPVNNTQFRIRAVLNSTFSITMAYVLTYALYPYIYTEGAVSVTRIVGEGVAILGLYDFFYYLVHRYPFHEWKLLRHVHAVHHVVKAPCAIDSLNLHPVETFLGMALLWACTIMVALIAGPVSVYSFAWAFTVYSLLNIIIHSGLELPPIPFAVINYLTNRHQKHHRGMQAKNYASVTPIFDILFSTEVYEDSQVTSHG